MTGCWLCCRHPVAVAGVGDAVHHPAHGGLQPDVSGAGPLQQHHRRPQAQRLRRHLHRSLRYSVVLPY